MVKSLGHIGWRGEFEVYERDGEIWTAHRTSVIDRDTGYRIGRYECSRALWDALKIVAPHALGILTRTKVTP